MRKLIASVVNKLTKSKAYNTIEERKAIQAARDRRDAFFGAIAPIEMLSRWRFFSFAALASKDRWRFPHLSFTRKGPGRIHDDFGTNYKMPWQSIHKSLTKRVNPDYTQNKGALEHERTYGWLPLHKMIVKPTEQDWLDVPASDAVV